MKSETDPAIKPVSEGCTSQHGYKIEVRRKKELGPFQMYEHFYATDEWATIPHYYFKKVPNFPGTIGPRVESTNFTCIGDYQLFPYHTGMALIHTLLGEFRLQFLEFRLVEHELVIRHTVTKSKEEPPVKSHGLLY